MAESNFTPLDRAITNPHYRLVDGKILPIQEAGLEGVQGNDALQALYSPGRRPITIQIVSVHLQTLFSPHADTRLVDRDAAYAEAAQNPPVYDVDDEGLLIGGLLPPKRPFGPFVFVAGEYTTPTIWEPPRQNGCITGRGWGNDLFISPIPFPLPDEFGEIQKIKGNWRYAQFIAPDGGGERYYRHGLAIIKAAIRHDYRPVVLLNFNPLAFRMSDGSPISMKEWGGDWLGWRD
jgi:hypothetical protein